jgi:hypothetical protein
VIKGRHFHSVLNIDILVTLTSWPRMIEIVPKSIMLSEAYL